MSIFITNLAFAGAEDVIHGSKMDTLAASCLAGVTGTIWLRWFGTPTGTGTDAVTMDYETDAQSSLKPLCSRAGKVLRFCLPAWLAAA